MERSSKDDDGFDPTDLGDPLASRIEWQPIARGGASFRTHDFVQRSDDRAEFRQTIGMRLFYLAFIGFGGVCAVIGTCIATLTNETLIGLGFLGGALLFGGCGVGIFLVMGKPIVFDKKRGWFWKGRTDPSRVADAGKLKHSAKLDAIHALQVVEHYVQERGGEGYCSYQLNVVTAEGKRIKVVDHGDAERLCHDANRLGQFLGKPVWNALG